MKKTHGQSRTRLYLIWMGMKRRCFSESFKQYSDYGGRGISITDSWMKFENFYENMGYSYKIHCEKYGIKNTSIDRIDRDGNYSKENCRWSTEHVQKRNTRRNNFILFNGETKCLTDWALLYGMKDNTLHNRLYRSRWSIERSLLTPTTR